MARIPLYEERLNAFMPDDDGEAFFAAIGRIIMYWGSVDNNLDIALSVINRPERDNQLYTKLTANQKRRQEALKNWLRNDPTLIHLRDDGETIIQAMSRIRVYRDIFTHGHFLGFSDGGPERIRFSTFPVNSRKKGRVRLFSLSQLRRISDDTEKLRFASLAFLVGVIGDDSMPASEIYDLARTRFRSNLDQLHILGRQHRRRD